LEALWFDKDQTRTAEVPGRFFWHFCVSCLLSFVEPFR
jgi:hypothetical protein